MSMQKEPEFFAGLPTSNSCPIYPITAVEIRPNLQKYSLDVLAEMC